MPEKPDFADSGEIGHEQSVRAGPQVNTVGDLFQSLKWPRFDTVNR